MEIKNQIIPESFPELKAMSFWIERAHQVLRTINKKQTIPRQTTVKFLNIGIKEKYPKKSQTEKQGIYQRPGISKVLDFPKAPWSLEDSGGILSLFQILKIFSI